MTDNPQPEAIRIADEFKLCLKLDSIPSIIDIEKAEVKLRSQHARIAELDQAKHTLLEASQALDAHSIRVHRKRDGLLMVNARGKSRFMTLRERIAYWLLGNTTDIRP